MTEDTLNAHFDDCGEPLGSMRRGNFLNS